MISHCQCEMIGFFSFKWACRRARQKGLRVYERDSSGGRFVFLYIPCLAALSFGGSSTLFLEFQVHEWLYWISFYCQWYINMCENMRTTDGLRAMTWNLISYGKKDWMQVGELGHGIHRSSDMCHRWYDLNAGHL